MFLGEKSQYESYGEGAFLRGPCIRRAPIHDGTGCHLWFASVFFDVSGLNDNTEHELRVQVPQSLAKASRQRKAEFLAGRFCAASVVGDVTGGWQVPAIGVDRAPVWPPGVVGSLTHTHGYAAAVAAKSSALAGLGLDSEPILSAERAAAIAPMVVQEQEFCHCLAAGLSYPLAMTLAFSAKESLFKAIYRQVGRVFGFESAAIVGVNPKYVSLALREDLGSFRRDTLFEASYRLDIRGMVHTMVVLIA